tara:strand:+ start:168 stop:1148 length:981 start_codon:yes stop_codon:yes gene_type:complete
MLRRSCVSSQFSPRLTSKVNHTNSGCAVTMPFAQQAYVHAKNDESNSNKNDTGSKKQWKNFAFQSVFVAGVYLVSNEYRAYKNWYDNWEKISEKSVDYIYQNSKECKDERLLALLAECKKELGIADDIALLLSDKNHFEGEYLPKKFAISLNSRMYNSENCTDEWWVMARPNIKLFFKHELIHHLQSTYTSEECQQMQNRYLKVHSKFGLHPLKILSKEFDADWQAAQHTRQCFACLLNRTFWDIGNRGYMSEVDYLPFLEATKTCICHEHAPIAVAQKIKNIVGFDYLSQEERDKYIASLKRKDIFRRSAALQELFHSTGGFKSS